MKNAEIRDEMRRKRVLHWMVAERMGVSEFTLCKWLRHALSHEKETKIRAAIEELEQERSEG